MIAAVQVVLRHRDALASLLCATLFFLGTADQVFTLHVLGVNVRAANMVLAIGLAWWLLARRSDATSSLATLAVGWAPFIALYGLAVVTSDSPWLGLLKLAWFAANFLTAFAWCRLFRVRTLASGFFAAFVVIAAVIVLDFTSGFTRGPQYMIGFGQPNDLTGAQILYRPHAFYYEPSYAATGLALAWALALTPLGNAAAGSTILLGLGLGALAATLSRTGWLYAAVVVVVLAMFHAMAARSSLRIAWPKWLVPPVAAALVCAGLLVSHQNREQLATLLHTLGWQQTFQRICPMLQEHVALIDLRCQSDNERRITMSRSQDAIPEQTSEGQRLVALEEAIEHSMSQPLLGSGVSRGEQRLIEPTTSNVWLELAVEGGLLSVAAFVWGLVFTLYRWRAFERENRAIAIVLALHFLLSWQFLQTFPRLDQWLIFWVALTFAASRARTSSESAAIRPTLGARGAG